MRPNLSNSALLAVLLAVLGAPLSVEAQELPVTEGESSGARLGSAAASEGATFLLLPVGARAVGMGGAVTGMRGSGDLLLWNPASVAGIEKIGLLFNHSESVFETQSEVISLVWPFESVGNFGVTYYLVDYGDLPSTSSEGTVQGTINFRNQEFLLTFAGHIVERLELGVNYKLVQLVYQCDGLCTGQQSFTSTTHAIDFGLIYDKLAGLPVALGASVRHLGPAMKGVAQEDPLPTRVRVGLAYQVLTPSAEGQMFGLALAVDFQDQWRDIGDPDVLLGTEFGVGEMFFLRAGYAFLESGLGGASLGLGLSYDWFYLDLSRGFDDIAAATGDAAVQLTFGVTF